MSSQASVSLSFTDVQLAAIDAALTELETQFAGLVGLTADQRRMLTKMGNKSEAFCRQTISLLGQNPQLVPESVRLADSRQLLAALDELRPRMQRLQRLGERIADTDTAVGSAVMQTALQGYALLKVTGRNQGLEALRESVGERFARKPRTPEAKAA
ncbi:hypothetical protein [Dokdonella sp.]|uniref:hypothetical protein n=1 Tax=Dokdonella sp. TaxID=2291710 RepID=UPI0037846EEA